jgi:microcin C transport system substrate-binding protein
LIDAFRNSLEEKERIELSRKIQSKIHEIGCFVPTFMVPYVRQAYWRWWRLPEIPGTKMTGDLFSPFGSTTGGLLWYDKDLHTETEKAMKSNQKFAPVTILNEKYKIKP